MKTQVRPYRTTFVEADPRPMPLTQVSAQPIEIAPIMPPATYTGHARQDDTATEIAKAALMVSAAYVAAALLITVGLLLIVWIFRGLGHQWANYVYPGLAFWGVAILIALAVNRRQSLHHSPTGIAHHELDSRERIARHAIDTHARLLLARWGSRTMISTQTHMEVELKRLRAENARLRKALRVNGRHARRIQRAYDAALLLATWHVSFLPTSREFAGGQGMPQRQWENGMALLRMAGVCDQQGRWRVHDLPTIEAALADAQTGANAAPDAFFARGNRHMQG